METKSMIETLLIDRAVESRRQKDGDNFSELINFKPGDTVIVAVRVIEGEKERIQNYQGIVISRRGSGINQSFIVRKISNGVGVERIFPLYSPMIQSIKLVRSGRTRRSKLYYLRGMSERKIRQKLK